MNSNRIQLSVALLAFLVLSVALILPTAAAPQGQVTFTAVEDVTLDPNRSGNLNAYPLQLAVQAGPAKAPTKVFLLKFNIGADPLGSNTPVVQAALSLAAIGKQCSNPADPVWVDVYGTTSSSWTETAAQWSTVGPGASSIRGSKLLTSDTTLPATGPAYWTGVESDLFAAYVENARTKGGVVSLWVEMAADAADRSTASFENRERIGQQKGCAGATLAPTLQIADKKPTPTNTSTRTPTSTSTSTSTSTPTSTKTPTSTPTNTGTPASTNTPTSTPTNTGTPTNTPTSTSTPTSTPSSTPGSPAPRHYIYLPSVLR